MNDKIKAFIDTWGVPVSSVASVGSAYYTRETVCQQKEEAKTNRLNGRRANLTLLLDNKISPLAFVALETENKASEKQILEDVGRWRDGKFRHASRKEKKYLSQYNNIERDVSIGSGDSCEGKSFCFLDKGSKRMLPLATLNGPTSGTRLPRVVSCEYFSKNDLDNLIKQRDRVLEAQMLLPCPEGARLKSTPQTHSISPFVLVGAFALCFVLLQQKPTKIVKRIKERVLRFISGRRD